MSTEKCQEELDKMRRKTCSISKRNQELVSDTLLLTVVFFFFLKLVIVIRVARTGIKKFVSNPFSLYSEFEKRAFNAWFQV